MCSVTKEIDCEALLDQCWAMLNRSYEESYGRGYGYHEPHFRFILTHNEINALRKYAVEKGCSSRVFIGVDSNTLFGHELRGQRRTPYLEAIVGKLGKQDGGQS